MYGTWNKGVKWFAAVSIFLMILLPILTYLACVMPVDVYYNRRFGSHVTMAYDQATFEGMEREITTLMQLTNETFSGRDFNTTYSKWWPPNQNYENSLGAQMAYWEQILHSIDNYQVMYAKMLNTNNTTILTSDWYYTSISNLRHEMHREGGLDWVLRDAYYLNEEPIAYWFFTVWTVVWVTWSTVVLLIMYKYG